MKQFGLLVILLVIMLAACSGSEKAPEPVIESADVSAVEMAFDDGVAIAIASGYLPDGCTTLNESTQTVTTNRIDISLTTTRPADMGCIDVIEEFREPILIDTTVLPKGEYTVAVNGVAATEPIVLGDEHMPQTALANVSSVDMVFDDAGTIIAIASGFFPDSCTAIYESTQTVTTNKVDISLATIRPADMMCSQVVEEFSEPILIDTSELLNGEYTVMVNGVAAAEPFVLGDALP